MENTFLKQVQKGKNQWWRYALTILATVAGIAIANIGLRQILPAFKSLFPDNQFGKDLGIFIALGTVFGTALLMFALASQKLHHRSFFSFINLNTKFNWFLYLKGFIIWGSLLFVSGLVTDFDTFQTFIDNFSVTHFLILFIVGFIFIGIQSFFEEIVIRGYFLQGIHLRIKNISILIIINTLIFGVLHFGYGIDSFIHSFTFGIAFAVVVLIQNRIEFVSGAHNANNLLLSLVFLDISEAASSKFSWSIDWLGLGIHLFIILVFVGIVYKFIKK